MVALNKHKNRREKADKFKNEIISKGVPFLGELVCWTSRSEDTHTQSKVRQALTIATLDPDWAPDILPKSAFTRACSEMELDRNIKIITRDAPITRFQYTKEFLNRKQGKWEFNAEGIVELNEDTGKITSSVQQLADMSQAELDKHMELRTTADITRIVQKYFERETDLIPLREQGGVYIVLQSHVFLIDKIEKFLQHLGGRMSRIPIPAGTPQGDRSVADSIDGHIKNIVKNIQDSVSKFNAGTREDTMVRAIEDYKQAQMKAKGMMHLLKSNYSIVAAEIGKSMAEAEKAVEKIKKQKEAAPKNEDGKKVREKLLGHKLTDAIRWMKVQGWKQSEMIDVLADFGIVVSINTIKTQCGRAVHWKGKKGGDPADFDAGQVRKLKAVYKKIQGTVE